MPPRSFMPFRILGSHTDSTGFTLKPRPDISGYGWQQLGIEIYGAPLLNSWLDRDLGLAGRLVLTDGSYAAGTHRGDHADTATGHPS